MPAIETALGLNLAIRIVMEDVWYSTALPEWYTPEVIDTQARAKRLRERAATYLKGAPPLDVVRLQLPRATGGTRAWVVPAVNDQMILHACVANLVPPVAKRFDRARVFSGEPNDNPNRLRFMKPQLVALLDFQRETLRRLQGPRLMLEFDIENAFASIDRAKFFDFVHDLKPQGIETPLIRRLVEAWSGGDPGLPLVNDSLFFLGSAYLNLVDAVVRKKTGDFIRFMDDYRIFGGSEPELESSVQAISADLFQMGLRINPRKVRIVRRGDFLGTVPPTRFATPGRGRRVSGEAPIELDTGINAQVHPELLATLVLRSLESPAEYLNEGYGRYVLGALRRYRLNVAIHRRAQQDETAVGVRLRELLTGNAKLMQLTGVRLGEFAADPRDAWRIIWIVYLIEQQGEAKRFQGRLAAIEQNPQLPAIARLWARRCRLGVGGEPKRLSEDLHDMSYLAAGQRCYGDTLCKGEGF
jgi:hypothetical protein